MPDTFAFDWEPAYRAAAAIFGVRPANAHVDVGDGHLDARFGRWQLRVPLGEVDGAHVTGPYGLAKTLGPARLSLADRGLTFATNHRRGLCIHLAEPVPAIEPLGLLRHPALTVTVADCERLAAALGHPTS